MDYNTNTWVKENVCSAAAIYGNDGVCWAYSPTFPELLNYTFELDDGEKKENVQVSEIDCAVQAAKGNRMPYKAGIRMGNVKYMLRTFEEDRLTSQLGKTGGGGASVGQLTTGVVIAFWDKEGVMSDGKPQNGPDVANQVAAMAEYLRG